MIQTLNIDSSLKNAMAKGIDGQITAKALTENIEKLPHVLLSFLEPPVNGVFNITWLG
jgi:PTS system cellobiose-specific IIC component